MWPAEDAWRAPIGDFPPPWASTWGDDLYGLWADLTVNGVTQRMRWIEPSGPDGFLMGSTKKERAAIVDKDARDWANEHEHEPRKECIDTGFWLAETTCTQAFWFAVVGENPSHFNDRSYAARRPVENVSWDAVMEQFVARFAQNPDWSTEDKLCLPSEKEWEYAARGGTRTAYWWGDQPDASANLNWPVAVDRYPPNSWGLYKMHGNVWEWCADVWRNRLDSPEAQPDETLRVVRGGSWFDSPGFARAACRNWWLRGHAHRSGGFRFAMRCLRRPEAGGVGAGSG